MTIWQKVEGVKVRSKILWYEEGEKSSQTFLTLEKQKWFKVLLKKLK